MSKKRKSSLRAEDKSKIPPANLTIQFMDEKKPLSDSIDMRKVMRIDPITRLREYAADKRLAVQKIARLQSEIKRAECEIASILCNPDKYAAEILTMVTSADDSDGRIVAGIATLDQINSLQYKAGYGELFTSEPA